MTSKSPYGLGVWYKARKFWISQLTLSLFPNYDDELFESLADRDDIWIFSLKGGPISTDRNKEHVFRTSHMVGFKGNGIILILWVFKSLHWIKILFIS